MNIRGNTILITGGGSGIGGGLAEAFHKAGNQVIIAGRNQNNLDAVVSANSGMRAVTLDIEDPTAIREFASRVAGEFPQLNVLINNAGISTGENLLDTANFESATAMVTTNLLGPMRLTTAFMPLLLKQKTAIVMNNTSGLAFIPLAMAPTYCATKAALHSYTESLRYQLKQTNVQVLELIPPYVQTSLSGAHQETDERAMPLKDFISEVMEILKTKPDAVEICVKNVEPLRFAAQGGQAKYEQMFRGLNDGFAASASH